MICEHCLTQSKIPRAATLGIFLCFVGLTSCQATCKCSNQLPKTAQDTIPFWEVYENGIFLVGEDKYSLIFSFENLDYKLLRDREQEEIYQNYEKLLNALPTDIHYQEFIMNSAINAEQLHKAMIPEQRAIDNELYENYYDDMKS